MKSVHSLKGGGRGRGGGHDKFYPVLSGGTKGF